MMTGHPAASADAALCAAIGAGAFHGHNSNAGPHPRRSTSMSPAAPSNRVLSTPSRSCAAASRKAPCRMNPSIDVIPMVAPLSTDSSEATCGTTDSRWSAIASRYVARSPAVSDDQVPASCTRQLAASAASIARGRAGPLLLRGGAGRGVLDPACGTCGIGSDHVGRDPRTVDQIELWGELHCVAHDTSVGLGPAAGPADWRAV